MLNFWVSRKLPWILAALGLFLDFQDLYNEEFFKLLVLIRSGSLSPSCSTISIFFLNERAHIVEKARGHCIYANFGTVQINVECSLCDYVV